MKKLITLIGVFACMLFLLPGDGWCPPPSAPTPAKQSKTVTTNFDGELSPDDDTVQKALDTLDDVVGVGDTTETNQDDAWKAVSDATGTETFITVTYQDATNDVDFVVPVLDEDDMATDSATNLATQQSIKAYVDAQVSTLTADSVQNSHIDWADIDNLGEEGLLTVTDTVDTTSFVGLFESATGDLAAKTDLGLTYNAGTGVLTATGFAGPITGAVTGNADSATLAATVTIADNEATNETNAVVFLPGGDLDGGNLALESDGTFNYNPSSGTVTATVFVGALTGNVTGNASGTAATVTGAAQAAITSVGTLTTLAVDNITINGNDISSTAGTDLTITPLAGQQIVLDGTIIIDAGAVTGATSITSTAFVGDITGDVTGNVSGTAGLASTVTIADNESTNETNAVVFLPGGDLDGGDLALESDGTFNYNPSTGVVTSTAFTGTKVTLTPADASPAADGEVLLDSTVTGLDDGALAYYEGGDTVYYVAAFPVLPVTDNHVLSYDSATDRLVWQADADSGGAPTLDNVVSPEGTWSPTMQDTEIITMTFEETDADPMIFSATGNFGDISIVKINQNTGTPTDGALLELSTTDAIDVVDQLMLSNGADDYVTHRIIEDGTYTIDVTSDNVALVAISDSVNVTGTISTSVGLDGIGAVDMDYGSADITDHTFVSDGGTTIIDGSIDLASLGITNVGAIADDAAITLISSGGTVTVESVVFTGGAVTSVTDLTASGTVGAADLTASDDVIVQDDIQLDSDGAIIQLGEDQDVTITHVADTAIALNLGLQMGDDQTIRLGSAATDWFAEFDDSVDDQLLVHTTADGAIATTDPMFQILVDFDTASGTNVTADQQVFGIAKGTQDTNVDLLTLDEDGDLTISGTLNLTSSDPSYIALANNAAIDPSGYRIYVDDTEWKVSENGSEEVLLTQEDGATIGAGTTWDFSAATAVLLPTTADAASEIGVDDSTDIFGIGVQDGAGAFISFDFTGIDGNDTYVMAWNEATNKFTAQAQAAGSPAWQTISDPGGDTEIEHAAGYETTFLFSGAYSAGSQFLINQTGDSTGGVLFEVKGGDANSPVARIGDGTNYWQVSNAGVLSNAGTATINAAAASDILVASGQIDHNDLAGATKIETTVTTEQLRLNYDATNYLTATVDAEGATTITTVDADAANANLTFSPDGTIILTPATDVVGAFTAASVTSDAEVAGTVANLTHTAPEIFFTDSTTSGEAKIIISDAAGPDGVMDLQVDVAGTLTTYVQLDGVNAVVDITPNLVLAGTLTDGTATLNSGAWSGISTLAMTGALSGATNVTTAAAEINGAITLANDETIANGTDTQIALTSNGNEDIVFDLDTATDNQVQVTTSTGVTELDFSAFQMVTTGDIMGGINVSSKAGAYTVGTDDASESYGTMFTNSNVADITLAGTVAVVGMSGCLMQEAGVTGIMQLEPGTGSHLVYEGVEMTDGTPLASAGAATDRICWVAISADHWLITSATGTWAE